MRARRTIESGSRDTLGIITVPLRQRERPHVGVVSLKKAVRRRAQVKSSGSLAQYASRDGVVPATMSCIRRTRAITASPCCGRRTPLPSRRTLFCAGAGSDLYGNSCTPTHQCARALGELHYNSGDAADEKRKRVLEHAPGYRVGRYSAASPVGREKSIEDWSPGSSSERFARVSDCSLFSIRRASIRRDCVLFQLPSPLS